MWVEFFLILHNWVILDCILILFYKTECCLNLIEDVDNFVLMNNWACWVEATSSYCPFLGCCFSVTSAFKAFAVLFGFDSCVSHPLVSLGFSQWYISLERTRSTHVQLTTEPSSSNNIMEMFSWASILLWSSQYVLISWFPPVCSSIQKLGFISLTLLNTPMYGSMRIEGKRASFFLTFLGPQLLQSERKFPSQEL